jgi:hypothetical protein
MSDEIELLLKMNRQIQFEQKQLKLETTLLSERKKALQEKEKEYLTLSLQALENK